MNHSVTTGPDFLAGGGEMATLIRSFDWSQTPLGAIDQWPQSLKTALNLMLNARQPMWIGWGPAVTFLYNDAYIPVLSLAKHPDALGKPAAVVWQEIWDFCGPLADKVFSRGEASFVDDVQLFMSRGDFLEETFYSFSYSPIRDESGQVAGLFCPNTEVTAQNLSTRRLATLSALATNALVEKTTRKACASVAQTLTENPSDVPFALIYLTSGPGTPVHLEQAVRLPTGDSQLSTSFITEEGTAPGSLQAVLASVMQQGKTTVGRWLNDEGLPVGPAGQTVNQAVVIPLIAPGQEHAIGVLVAGINPTRQLDTNYRTFFELIASQLASAVQNAQLAEEERQRLDQLAELNRAKTLFFSNISHEFRTPLTLMLGTLDELLRGHDGALNPAQHSHAQAAHRNARRLLRLVNTLLDFSRLEAGRLQADISPTDLPTLTADLASSFRSIIENAGMELVVDTAPLPDLVAVDQSMWEKIVLNLLSNAFKFTLSGTITVRLTQTGNQITLTVQDTGVGIPEADIPRLFERFHRVDGSRGRSFEGTGIGLALVNELVELHGGTIGVQSELGRGSVFTVQLPLRQAQPSAAPDQPRRTADLFVADAEFMMAPEPVQPLPATELPTEQAGRAKKRILLVDDNADMRAYIHRLLSPHYSVEVAANGRDALTAIQRSKPDLVVSDIMMPHLDGTELLKILKSDPKTAHIPILLLSARAGEEATQDGYEAGADDYLTKPFTANELLVRVRAQLKLAQVRQENQEKLRHLFKQAPVAIAMLEGPQHLFTLANDRYLQLLDRPEADLLGRPFPDFFPDFLPEQLTTVLDRIWQTGEPFVVTDQALDVVRPGSWRKGYFTYLFQALTDQRGQVTGIIIVAHEVTDSVMARQKIEASEKELQHLFEQAPIVLSIIGREPDLIYRMANAAYAQLIDRPLDAIIGRPMLDVLPEIKGQGFDQLLTQVMTTGQPYIAREAPVSLTRDGVFTSLYLDFMYYPVRTSDGEVTGAMVVAIDVTQQVTARQQIEASQKQFEQLADLVPQILWTAQPDGSVDYFNQPWYDYTGFDKVDGDQTWVPILHPDDAQACIDHWNHSVTTGEPYQIEYRFADRRRPGSYRWFMGRAVPVREETSDGEPGRIIKWFGSCTDIHQSKVANEELERRVAERTQALHTLNTDLERSNFDLMQFASVASHDLKEPLRKIQAFSNLLMSSLDGKLDQEEQTHFSRIIRAADRMQTLVDDVLRLSKLSKLDVRYEPVDLNRIIARIQDDLEITIREKNAVLTVGPLPLLDAVPGQMHQLFLNLISNALKFVDARPPVISIEAASSSDTTRPLSPVMDQPPYVTIRVRDNGIGFEMRYMDKIFGMFQRLHRRGQYEGTGIGLAICRRIVENHHGSIRADSSPGQGAMFEIVLPLSQKLFANLD